MEDIPSAEQVLANSSGVAAPSRKLKAERACSSRYISRTLHARTIFPATRHNKNNTSRAKLEICRKKQFPDPRRLPATVGSPTIVRKNARVRMHEPLFRSNLEMTQMPACFPATEHARERADEKHAERWREFLLSNDDSSCFANCLSQSVLKRFAKRVHRR